MKRNPIPLAAAAVLLTGCTMIPKYTRPEPPVPPSWPDAAVHGAEPEQPVDVPWQEFFIDDRLRSVIETALAGNRDLRVATLNVEKAAAFYRIQRAELFPALGIQAVGERSRIPEKATGSGAAETSSLYSFQVGTVAWELDLFGRIRSLKTGALEQYFATEEGRVAVRIALIAGTARAWLLLAADAENLRLARETLETQRATLDLIRKTAEMGMVSDLDVRQAESQVETARADVARYTGLVAVDRNTLDLLAGTTIADPMLSEELNAVTGPGALAPGLPSEVLLRRPDILAAEHQLKAMNANIGAARAAFFPRIALTGGGGAMSTDLSNLFSSGTGTWSFAARLVTPIFMSGAAIANLKAAKVDREIAVARYEKAIQVAFSEVGDSLALRSTLVEQRDAQEALVRALEETYRLSDARYKAGLDGYLGVLVAERSLLVARHALVGVRLAEQTNMVTLYEALGGGASDGVDREDAGGALRIRGD